MELISKLLIEERPLTILPSLVELVGIGRAVILQQVHYACQQPRSGIVIEGDKYIWNTYQDWQSDYFPFWSERNIQQHFLTLEKEGYIVYKQPKLSEGDSTKYYRVNVKVLESKLAELRQCTENCTLGHGATFCTPRVQHSVPPYKEAKASTKIERDTRTRVSEFGDNRDILFTDPVFQVKFEETLTWVAQRKKLKNVPPQDWANLFARLDHEGIDLDEFKEFYRWLEQRPWIKGIISIRLIEQQVEAWKNREELEARERVNGNGRPGKTTAAKLLKKIDAETAA